MKFIKVGAAAVNQTPLDWDGNANNIISAVNCAINTEIKILCLPELCVTGYGCEDAFFMSSVIDTAWSTVTKHIIPSIKNKDIIYTLGLPIIFNKALYNCIVVIDSGQISCIIPKQNLCSNGVHYETRWFKAWKSNEIYNINGIPFGNIILESKDHIRIGFEICEDAWVPERPGINLAKNGVDIILNPSASHFAFNKEKSRVSFIKEGSRAFNCVYVYSNLLGNESGRIIFDGDTYIANKGEVVAAGPRFSFEKKVITSHIFNPDQNKAKQIQNGFYSNDISYHVIKVSNVKYELSPQKKYFKNKTLHKFEAFESAVSLGLYDYMIKTKSKGFVLSLSGGYDSAAVACLVREMARRAIKKLGYNTFVKQISQNNIEVISYNLNDIIGRLLTCCYLSTDNSSKETEAAAKHLAESMGANFHNFYIQNIVSEYEGLSEFAIGRELSWSNDDIALQNIQARARAPMVWMLANLKNALLLCTSNRSEIAVGYTSMDGDSCGGLAPIAGVSKSFIKEWLHFYKTKDHNIEFKGLDLVLELQPTAELQPKEFAQTDEKDLMPYYILNQIELMAVRDKMSPIEIYEHLTLMSIKRPHKHVIKFFKLFCQNQWKRERFAVSFHLDDESLDPKTFCRWPVLNSGMKKELKELEKIYEYEKD